MSACSVSSGRSTSKDKIDPDYSKSVRFPAFVDPRGLLKSCPDKMINMFVLSTARSRRCRSRVYLGNYLIYNFR